MKVLFLVFILLLNSISSDVTINKALLDKFQIIQIKKGIDDETTSFGSKILLKAYVYSKDNKFITSFIDNFSLGFHGTPKCIDYVASYMSKLERVRFLCPLEYGFQPFKAEHFGFTDENIKQDLYLDIQMWNFGPHDKNLD